jgi:hypothetical protein
MHITLLLDLPVVIDGKGNYFTRGGDWVLIDQYSVLPESRKDCTAFLCKGYRYQLTSSNRIKATWEIYHESGRLRPLEETQHDILGAMPHFEILPARKYYKNKAPGTVFLLGGHPTHLAEPGHMKESRLRALSMAMRLAKGIQ